MAGFVVKVTIEETHPPVWRRVILPQSITFADLHKIIQVLFGWENVHLHDFSFPQSDYRIASTDPYDDGEYDPEDMVCIDELLRNCKWIRYTYDFGDEWKHKIVLEKEDADYHERYACVVKYKGENFSEDSGGVKMSEERVPFSAENTNAALQNLVFPEFAMDEHSQLVANMVIQEQKIEQISQEIAKLLDKLEKMEKDSTARKIPSKKPSGIDRQVKQWENFYYDKLDYEEFLKYTDDIPTPEMPNIVDWKFKETGQAQEQAPEPVQLMIPMLEEESEPVPEPERKSRPSGEAGKSETKEEPVPEGDLYQIKVQQSSLTIEDMLLELNTVQAADYCKYLQIHGPARESKKNRVHRIAKMLSEHPEYYYYVLDKEDIKGLKKLWKRSVSTQSMELQLELQDEEEEAMWRAIRLGLLRVDICNHKDRGITIAELSFAADVGEFLEKTGSSAPAKTYRWLDQMGKKVKPLVSFYGAIEIEALYRIYCDLYQDSIEKEDFFRYIYWHCRMSDYLETFVQLKDQVAFCAMPELDLNRILEARSWFAADLEYHPVSQEDLRLWKEGSLEINEAWRQVTPFLFYQLEISKNMIQMLIDDMLTCIKSGGTLQEVCEILEEVCPIERALDAKKFWELFMPVIMKTNLPCLNGYSREEFIYKKKSRSIPSAVSEEDLMDSVDSFTHIMEMPWELQFQIYDLIINQPPGEVARQLQEIRRQTSTDNVELLLMQIEFLMMDGNYERAEGLVKRVKKLDPGEEDYYDRIIQEIRDFQEMEAEDDSEESAFSFQDPLLWPFSDNQEKSDKSIPYIREQKKVGRNDLCPCGSGKKYKKCCGKLQS